MHSSGNCIGLNMFQSIQNLKTQVQSMPELKSVSLTVGRKALHSKPGGFNSPSNRSFNRFVATTIFLLDIIIIVLNSPGNRSFNSPTQGSVATKGTGSGYVPSQMEAKPKPNFQVLEPFSSKISVCLCICIYILGLFYFDLLI